MLEPTGTIGAATVFRTQRGDPVLHLIITTRMRAGFKTPSVAWRAEALDLDVLLDAYKLDATRMGQVLMRRQALGEQYGEVADRDTDLEELLGPFREGPGLPDARRHGYLFVLLVLARSASFADYLAANIAGRSGHHDPRDTGPRSAAAYMMLFSLAKWAWEHNRNPLQNDAGHYVLFRDMLST